MPGEKKIETPKLTVPASMSNSSAKLPKKDMGKERLPSNSFSSVAIDQPLSVYYASCYDYSYPGYNGTFPQSDDKGYINTAGGSYTDNDTPFVYYLPGYGYTYTSSDYLQQPCSYGSETFPCYAYDLAYSRNNPTGPGSVKSMVGPSGSGKSNGYYSAKTNNYNNNHLSSNIPALPSNSRTQQPASYLSRSIYEDKLGSNFHSYGFANRNLGVYAQYDPINYQSNNKIWYSDYRYRSKDNFGRNGEIKSATELTRGPRADSNKNNSSEKSEVEQHSGFSIDRNKYNLKEFQTDYDNAKLFVIKSYSEDDVHKCIKHDVWSSTPNGNKKLYAAYCEAEAKTNETGVKCPIFLFFSVNGSGQFVGVAEMIGQVDFDKNMDFWQLDKWNGFFPIKWHIIKDVPNTLLRHIILENNDNKPVTYSRDTQEIGLKQGLEMLRIFKSHSETTSVIDDFNFYEDREKALKAKKKTSQISDEHEAKNFEGGVGMIGEQSTGKTNQPSLVSLTENLTLNSQPV